jgi:hypothetical protein
VPSPGGLVVKNGSTARAMVAASMPEPVSLTATRRYLPGSRSPVFLAMVTGLDSMVTSPPAGVASRALTTRFSSAASNWPESIRVLRTPAPSRREKV